MLEKIKKAVLSYYLLNFANNDKKVTFEQREEFIKKLFNRIVCPIIFLGVIVIGSTVFSYQLIAKLFFPLFLLSLIPYFMYVVMLKLHHNEKKLRKT
jgi:hypothetical protein